MERGLSHCTLSYCGCLNNLMEELVLLMALYRRLSTVLLAERSNLVGCSVTYRLSSYVVFRRLSTLWIQLYKCCMTGEHMEAPKTATSPTSQQLKKTNFGWGTSPPLVTDVPLLLFLYLKRWNNRRSLTAATWAHCLLKWRSLMLVYFIFLLSCCFASPFLKGREIYIKKRKKCYIASYWCVSLFGRRQ